mmetsp:Transcript_15573/g.36051  ORF Transcript_15573/g.36051 Transcript_15573/m.36051 type:complete len:241 (-) Transcript_15573:26-748(-)
MPRRLTGLEGCRRSVNRIFMWRLAVFSGWFAVFSFLAALWTVTRFCRTCLSLVYSRMSSRTRRDKMVLESFCCGCFSLAQRGELVLSLGCLRTVPISDLYRTVEDNAPRCFRISFCSRGCKHFLCTDTGWLHLHFVPTFSFTNASSCLSFIAQPGLASLVVCIPQRGQKKSMFRHAQSRGVMPFLSLQRVAGYSEPLAIKMFNTVDATGETTAFSALVVDAAICRGVMPLVVSLLAIDSG